MAAKVVGKEVGAKERVAATAVEQAAVLEAGRAVVEMVVVAKEEEGLAAVGLAAD